MRSFLVTGGAGFIGSSFVAMLLARGERVVVLDALTYAGHEENLASVWHNIVFVRGDISDSNLVSRLLEEHQIDTVVNFAAESHVDRSIENAADFVRTNVMGVFSLLNVAHAYFEKLLPANKERFRFVQISTDEVFGELGEEGYFSETSPYRPNSPYSASKAGGDHLARAWCHTYKLPVIITNCSNNYGPRQFPEKLIPHIINCALNEKPLPVYGKGENVRDWIHVEDHCLGIILAVESGIPGETYCFGGRSERKNISVVKAICRELDLQRPRNNGRSYADLITFVADRKGHDWRYAIDDTKSETELGFKRKYQNFEIGLCQTVAWYLANQKWIDLVMEKKR